MPSQQEGTTAAGQTGEALLQLPMWKAVRADSATQEQMKRTAQLAVGSQQGFALEIPSVEGARAITMIFRSGASQAMLAEPCWLAAQAHGSAANARPPACLHAC